MTHLSVWRLGKMYIAWWMRCQPLGWM
jgi:hypothetical protein